MNKRKLAVISLLLGGLLLIGALFLSGVLRSRGAGLLVESDTPSQVYINNEVVGRTPFSADLETGEITVKVVPDAIDKPSMPYETKVVLESGIETVIRRNLGETLESSSGEVISFKKTGGEEASIAVVSIPDGAQVILDGQNKGTTPLTISDVSVGVHNMEVKAPGFTTRQFGIKTAAGYRLTAIVNLAVSTQKEIPEATPEAQIEEKKQVQTVEILTTPTGFLRVREEATTASREIAQVKPGDTFELIEENSQKSWYKVKIDENTQGWVTSEFAKLGSRTE